MCATPHAPLELQHMWHSSCSLLYRAKLQKWQDESVCRFLWAAVKQQLRAVNQQLQCQTSNRPWSRKLPLKTPTAEKLLSEISASPSLSWKSLMKLPAGVCNLPEGSGPQQTLHKILHNTPHLSSFICALRLACLTMQLVVVLLCANMTLYLSSSVLADQKRALQTLDSGYGSIPAIMIAQSASLLVNLGSTSQSAARLVRV